MRGKKKGKGKWPKGRTKDLRERVRDEGSLQLSRRGKDFGLGVCF